MLTTWTLSRFKSAGTETRLALAPLTVFAGANSSGKSTVIQSMLLTTQTLQSPVSARPVVLNGHIARLGSFTDIVSDADETSAIMIGFQLVSSRPRLPSYATRAPFISARFRTEGPLTVDCSFTFSVRGDSENPDILRLQPLLEESRLTVSAQAPEHVEEAIVIRRAEQDVKERVTALHLSDEYLNRPEASSLRYEMTRLNIPPAIELEQLEGATKAGVSFVHFLPIRLSIVYDAVDAEANELAEALVIAGPHSLRALAENKELINAEVLQILVPEFREARKNLPKLLPSRRKVVLTSLDAFEQSPSPELLLAVYQDLPAALRGGVAPRLGEKLVELKKAARGGRPPKYDIRLVPLSPLLAAGVSALQEFFSSSVKYLGPLRDEPKPVYPLAGATDPKDVGFKGEHTAAVLDLFRNATVHYIPSKTFDEPRLQPLPQPAALSKAVLDWLKYMGVGTQLDTRDRGKLGHELKIATSDGPNFHDLTQVGVGVSQVLPILVLSLLADQGSLLIFEQPELHLHPRVQTRLGDFFFSMTRLGKQCVVETHSEYLINRLRYLSAISEGKQVSDSVIIYFVEKEGDRSTYRKVLIDEFGAIPDWPRGFFDESDKLATAVLRAGMEKRRSSREPN